jgi:riboflavin kinase/FMN adenylyltransferase
MTTLYYPPVPYAAEPLQPLDRCVATIGFFDGVHRGHRFLIDALKQEAQRRSRQSMVITFDRHPRQVLQPQWHPQLLTTLEEKTNLLKETGIDVLVILRFDAQMAQLSARDFMQQVLQERFGADVLLTGYDNRFGHNREEGFDDYVRFGKEIGMDVVCAKPLAEDGQCFSSSLVRRMLTEGRVEETTRCLGRPYQLTGSVVHGERIGRTLGFPTANLQLHDDCRMVPANGVYAVQVSWEQNPIPRPGMMNIGTRPTFDGHRQTLEVHLFDFSGNLYGHQLRIDFIAHLRQEQHFDSPEALTRQMEQDAQQARHILL